ncbi:hypothetical protein LguiA_029944 [Lonicera macranthoides]
MPASTRAQANSYPTKDHERKKQMVMNMPGGPMDPFLLKSFESRGLPDLEEPRVRLMLMRKLLMSIQLGLIKSSNIAKAPLEQLDHLGPTDPRSKCKKVIEEVKSGEEEDNENSEKEKDDIEDEDGESGENENDNEQNNESGENENDCEKDSESCEKKR